VCAVDKRACGLSGSCVVHPVWVEARQQVERFLRSKNFAQLTSARAAGSKNSLRNR
jgi:DNA-binding IscR family transcriptional regulator